MAVSSGDRISLWGISRAAHSEGEPGRLVANVTSLAYSPDGALMAAGDAGGRLWLWNYPTGSNAISQIRAYPPLSGATGQIISLAFNNPGDTLYLGMDNGTIQRWDLRPQTWARLACLIAGNRDFTWQEWEEFFPGQELQPTCSRQAFAVTPSP